MKKIKLVAVASEGGHWMQLTRLVALFDNYDTTYITTDKNLPESHGISNYVALHVKLKSVQPCIMGWFLSCFIPYMQLCMIIGSHTLNFQIII